MARFSHSAVVTLVAVALLAAALLASACNSGSSPTAPDANRNLVLSEAALVVNGQAVSSGSTYQHNHEGPNGVTRFEATLRDANGPAPGHVVEVHFRRPHGMMNGSGHFRLYDDGTHGDRIAGDGIYCYEDRDGAYGFCHRRALNGEYHYDFCGYYPDGAETNHRMIDVDVVD